MRVLCHLFRQLLHIRHFGRLTECPAWVKPADFLGPACGKKQLHRGIVTAQPGPRIDATTQKPTKLRNSDHRPWVLGRDNRHQRIQCDDVLTHGWTGLSTSDSKIGLSGKKRLTRPPNGYNPAVENRCNLFRAVLCQRPDDIGVIPDFGQHKIACFGKPCEERGEQARQHLIRPGDSGPRDHICWVRATRPGTSKIRCFYRDPARIGFDAKELTCMGQKLAFDPKGAIASSQFHTVRQPQPRA